MAHRALRVELPCLSACIEVDLFLSYPLSLSEFILHGGIKNLNLSKPRHQVSESNLFCFVLFCLSFCLLGPHLRHMEVPRLGIESELQPLAYTTATATPDPSRVWDLHHSSW